MKIILMLFILASWVLGALVRMIIYDEINTAYGWAANLIINILVGAILLFLWFGL